MIILPLISFVSVISSPIAEGFNYDNYLERWRFIMIPSTIISGIIIAFSIIALLQNPYTYQWLFYSIIPEIIFVIHVIIWSDMLYINFLYYNSVIIIDLSIGYKLLIIIPGIILVRNSMLFIYRKSELKIIGFVLKTIDDNPKSHKYHIRNKIKKNLEIDQKIKQFIQRNLSKILLDLETKREPLLINDNGYYLTKKGGISLKIFETLHKDKHNIYSEDTLETWTLKDLKKYKKERSIK